MRLYLSAVDMRHLPASHGKVRHTFKTQSIVLQYCNFSHTAKNWSASTLGLPITVCLTSKNLFPRMHPEAVESFSATE
jgi:hypothetical protein